MKKNQTVFSMGIRIFLIAAAYALTGWAGLAVALPPGIATPLWVPSGIALAAVLLFGRSIWPGIILGSILVNFKTLFESTHSASFYAVLLAIALGSLLQAFAGAYFIRRFHAFMPFTQSKNVSKFVCIETLSCLISPTIGTASLLLANAIPWQAVQRTWWTWWTGDLVGVIVAAPFLMAWAQPFRKIWNAEKIREVIFYAVWLMGITYVIFGQNFFGWPIRAYLMPYVLVPFVIWAAFRFSQKGLTFSVFVISLMAIWGAVNGKGFFVRENLYESFLILQPFMAILSITGLILNAAVIERRRAHEELHKSRKNLMDFFENAPVGLHWVGPNGIIIKANQAELDLLGYAKEEYVGHSIKEFHTDQSVICDVLERLKNHEAIQEYEARLRCKDGSVRDVIISSNVLWENEHFVHTRCFTRDITDRKRAEGALIKAHAELEERVKTRTQELFKAYKALEIEMSERWKAQKDIIEISEREQKRIGQDLHNGLAQQLSGISLMSKTLQYKLAAKGLPEEEDVIQILGFLKSALEETKRVSRGFYSVELEKLGLFPALEELAINKEKMYGIPCRCQFDTSIEIKDDAAAKHVYRITQEAVLNALKHGKPSQVDISMKREMGGQIVLTIEDDGIGIDKSKLSAQMGLRIMEYRAKMVGADFSIENHEKGGVRVTFAFQQQGFPLHAGAPIP